MNNAANSIRLVGLVLTLLSICDLRGSHGDETDAPTPSKAGSVSDQQTKFTNRETEAISEVDTESRQERLLVEQEKRNPKVIRYAYSWLLCKRNLHISAMEADLRRIAKRNGSHFVGKFDGRSIYRNVDVSNYIAYLKTNLVDPEKRLRDEYASVLRQNKLAPMSCPNAEYRVIDLCIVKAEPPFCTKASMTAIREIIHDGGTAQNRPQTPSSIEPARESDIKR